MSNIWKRFSIFKGHLSVMMSKKKNSMQITRSYESLKKYYKTHSEKQRQGSKGGSKGGRKERKRRRKGGRREGEVLQLYPELQGSQEFHPLKSSFFLALSFSLCLWKILRALSTTQLLLYFHTVSHMKTDTVVSRVLPTVFCTPKPLLPLCCPKWTSPNSECRLP